MLSTPSTLCLYSSGSNARGQLGHGEDDDAHTFWPCVFLSAQPRQLPEGTTVLHVACGANHTLVLLARRESGACEVWGCGDGRKGQLGPREDNSDRSGSVFRPLDLRVEDLAGYSPRLVAAGWETSYVVFSRPGKSDVLISMGADDFGNLGIGGGGTAVYRVPLLAAFPDMGEHTLTVWSLSAGPHHVVAVVSLDMVDGSTTEGLVGWGTSRHGQLGHATSGTQKASPIQNLPRAIHVDGTRSALGSVSHSALGNQHTVFLHSSAKVSGIGSNRKSQLALLDTIDGARGVACTWNGTYVLTRYGSDDQIIALGSNNHGQLGRTTVEPSGDPGRVNFPSPTGSPRILKLACGSEHVLCLVETNQDMGTRREVWGWGWNEHGNLGNGTTEDVHAPLRIYPTVGDDAVNRVLDVWGGNGTSWIVVER
ncbi:regulator of chromosome condensation 1/beta-lactamase-inhibitor protein II [Fomitopsis betulina]|nr:regulator of chromosome condensation 1/beta-lactamase-inhibitor protein II [Fomitopsis betulina]